MIDLSSLKAPGWQRIVAELTSHCPDDKTFLERLLRVMARVSAARQAVVFLPGGDAGGPDVRPICVWPAPGPGGEDRVSPMTDGTPLEFASDVRSAAATSIETGEARAFGLEKKKSALYGQDAGEGFLLAVPLPGPEGKPAAAVTMLIEPRSKQAVQSTLAMAEVLAGYVSGHTARQQLRRTQSASFALDLASKLIGSLNTASNFKGASLQLVNDLAKQFKAERAALGWVRHDKVKVVAISDTEHFDRRMAMVQKLEGAMDECMDQEQPVVFPPPTGDVDVLLAQAIAHSHRELASSGGAGRVSVCSVPLRDGEKVVGVVTLEFAAPPGTTGGGPLTIDLQTVELFQASMDLVAPVVALRKNNDRHLGLRAWDDVVKLGAWVVGPKHTVWKMVAVVVTAAFLFVTFFSINYRIGAEAAVQPRTKHVISVPYEGLIKDVPEGVEPGSVVKKGDVLVQMDTTELELSAAEAEQNIAKARGDLAKAQAEGKPGEAQQAIHDEQIAQSTLAQARTRIRLSRIVAPIDGTILAGKIRERVGSSVKTGDKLFEIAPLADIVVMARVDERDVALIKTGTKGRLATRSHPSEPLDFEVEAVVPLAEPEEGKNLFEVRCKLLSPAPGWLRPGMEGIAKLETQDRSLLYIGTRRVLDAVRLWLW